MSNQYLLLVYNKEK